MKTTRTTRKIVVIDMGDLKGELFARSEDAGRSRQFRLAPVVPCRSTA